MKKWRLLFNFALSLLLGLTPLLTAIAQAEGEDDPLWHRPSFEKKVYRVAQRILKANDINEAIEFLYDKHEIRNATASRFGGPNTIVVYKDMLDVMESDDELAAVLGHEIAHITKRHTGKTVPKEWAAKTAFWTTYVVGGTAATLATGGLAAPVFILGAKGVQKAHRNGITLTARINQPYEKEADLVGLDYMVKAGYDPNAMESMFRKFVGDAGPFAQFFSSHPGGSERLEYIHEAIKTKYPQFLAEKSQTDPVTANPSGDSPAKQTEASATASASAQPSQTAAISSVKPVSLMATTISPKPLITETTKSAPISQATLAQRLLSLSTDEMQLLKRIIRNGYLSQGEMKEEFEVWDTDYQQQILTRLHQLQFIKVLGANPEQVFVLTDAAAPLLLPQPNSH